MTCDNKGQKRSIAFSPIALYLGWTKFQRKLYFYNIYAIFWKSWNLPFSDRCSSYDFNTTDYVTYGGKLQLLSFETVISQNVKSVSNIVRVKVYFRKTVPVVTDVSTTPWMSARLPFRNTYHKGFSLFMGQTRYHAPDKNSCLFWWADRYSRS